MISSSANGQIKELVKLQKSARERKKAGLFIAEGLKMTREAAQYGSLEKIYLTDTFYAERDEGLDRLLSRFPYELVTEPVMRVVSDTVTPQGILALVRIPQYAPETLLNEANGNLLLLDGVSDPGNLGTMLRTAEGAGMAGVVLSRACADLWNPKTVRATMGSALRVPFCYTEDLAGAVNARKKAGHPVYGAAMEGSILYDRADYRQGADIVIGNEANGISSGVRACLTGTVSIPMQGKVESLNAAVAAAILMYEIARQTRDAQGLQSVT